MVTNVVPVLVVRRDVVAGALQCRSRGEVAVMMWRSEGPLYPSRYGRRNPSRVLR